MSLSKYIDLALAPSLYQRSTMFFFVIQLNVSPIETVDQTTQGYAPCTPSPPVNTGRQNIPISPEVEEILRQQDSQLKALQQQIQKLLKAQEGKSLVNRQQKTATTQTTSVAAVNTGVSLLQLKPFDAEVNNILSQNFF